MTYSGGLHGYDKCPQYLTDTLSTPCFYTMLQLHPVVAYFKPAGLRDVKKTVTLSNSIILCEIFENMGRIFFELYASYREVLSI